MQKKKPGHNGIVYSTNPDFRPEQEDEGGQDTLPPGQQKLAISLDTKQRAGKAVTLVEGFAGTEPDLEDLGKKLKAYCGTGGSVKEGMVIIQGDHREKVRQWLGRNGYTSLKMR